MLPDALICFCVLVLADCERVIPIRLVTPQMIKNMKCAFIDLSSFMLRIEFADRIELENGLCSCKN